MAVTTRSLGLLERGDRVVAVRRQVDGRSDLGAAGVSQLAAVADERETLCPYPSPVHRLASRREVVALPASLLLQPPAAAVASAAQAQGWIRRQLGQTVVITRQAPQHVSGRIVPSARSRSRLRRQSSALCRRSSRPRLSSADPAIHEVQATPDSACRSSRCPTLPPRHRHGDGAWSRGPELAKPAS